LCDGFLLAWLGKSGQSLLTFLPTDSPQQPRMMRALAEALASLVETGRRRVLLLSTIDGRDAIESPLGDALAQSGFLRGAKGWMRRRGPASHDPPGAFEVAP
jgi:ATP-dependent Lhr-like helicase